MFRQSLPSTVLAKRRTQSADRSLMMVGHTKVGCGPSLTSAIVRSPGDHRMQLVRQPQWAIYDSTKIQDYMLCPRKYLFNHILGWSREHPNIDTPSARGGLFKKPTVLIKDKKSVDLVFGSAWHKSMEVLLSLRGDDPGYPSTGFGEAISAFYKEWYEYFAPGDEEHFKAKRKTPKRAEEMLRLYTERYCNDNFRVLDTEMGGVIEIDGVRIAFVIDAICEDPQTGDVFVLEHKTASASLEGIYFDQWRQKMQIGVYSAVLRAMYPEKYAEGQAALYVNAANVRAGNKESMFRRHMFIKSPEQFDDWAATIAHYIGSIETDTNMLFEDSNLIQNESVLFHFPKNTESCTKYGKCTYIDYCEARPNPLLSIEPPPGFSHRLWDPIKEREHIQKLSLKYRSVEP